jgi:ATP-dependent exoDNAse (exonuclease V) alpha subunit
MKSVCENTVTVLQGFAGSGKSFSVLALMNMLRDNYKTAILVAPTGRASKVLKKYTQHEASTIHRGLAFRPPKLNDAPFLAGHSTTIFSTKFY